MIVLGAVFLSACSSPPTLVTVNEIVVLGVDSGTATPSAPSLPEAGGWESNLFEVLQTVSETSLGFEGIGFTELDLSQFTPLDGSSVDQRGTEPQLTDMTFQVVVDCADESEQREVIEQMEKEGRSVRALTM